MSEAEHLYVIHPDRAPSWRDIPYTTSENTFVRTCERAFLDCDIIEDVKAIDLDVRIWKGDEPAPEELRTGRLSLAAYPGASKTTSSASTPANSSMS
jgi:hypothetical protein